MSAIMMQCIETGNRQAIIRTVATLSGPKPLVDMEEGKGQNPLSRKRERVYTSYEALS